MNSLFLIFNHRLTQIRKDDALASLNVNLWDISQKKPLEGLKSGGILGLVILIADIRAIIALIYSSSSE